MIAIIDYGVGNLFSLTSSLRYIGAETIITAEAGQIERADRILLPGVGAFGDAIAKLRATGLIPTILAQAAAGKPLMGICLGMQLLFDQSFEYGRHPGLGLIPGSICDMQPDLAAAGFDYKVPHMGWNALRFHRPDCPLLANTQEGAHVYFVHSFYAKDCDPALVASAEYGLEVPAIVNRDNVYGCQFHPEKSGEAGLGILRAFCKL